MVAEDYVKCSDPACDNGEEGAQSPCELAEKCVSACAAYGKVCPCASRAAGRSAVKAMQKLTEDSRLFPEKPDFIQVNCDDLVIGKKLGEGGFSVVHEVVLRKGEEQGQIFAIKYLKRKVMVDKRLFELGAADLAMESMFLATLNHPNIIKYHGISAGSIASNVASGKECGFFIVIDRLNDTLEKRIEKWADEAKAASGSLLYRMSHEYKVKRKAALMERLKVALQIAECMEYLHSLGIIYRDLKPENCAFDGDGVLKLFDFGLAVELRPERANEDGKYKLTGNTGSRRYMAPEVAKSGCPYDESVDVFSFGILLWELCAMEKPFFGYTANKHLQQVVLGGERPRLDASNTSWWPVNLHWLMKRCWSADAASRPSFTIIKETIQGLIGCVEEVKQPCSEQTLSTSVPKEGFASIKRAQKEGRAVTTTVVTGGSPPVSQQKERAVTIIESHNRPPAQKPEASLTPPSGGFASLKPAAVMGRHQRAQSHGETKSGRKISLGIKLRRSNASS